MVASYKSFYRKIGFVLAELGFLRIPSGLWVAGGRRKNDRTKVPNSTFKKVALLMRFTYWASPGGFAMRFCSKWQPFSAMMPSLALAFLLLLLPCHVN